MKIDILHVPGCPNLPLLAQRLQQALDGRRPTITRILVPDLDAAVAAGMTGSPTLLVDGIDPFAEPGSAPSVSCRLYRDTDGRIFGAPSTAALRHILLSHSDGEPRNNLGNCCTPASNPAPLRSSLRDWRAGATPADPAERAIHQAILRSFATTGTAPEPVTLEQTAAPFAIPAGDLLRRLHERDVIRLDPDGRISAAYPFSAVPTGHHVQLDEGPMVEAMCVIDALGIPAMLNTDAVITTTAPTTGQPITVTVAGGRTAWDPATAVVFLGARAGDGPSADVCCGYLNAFPNQAAGTAWATTHPDVLGDIIGSAHAEQLARHIFGNLLDSTERGDNNR